MMQHEYEKLRKMLVKNLAELIGDADIVLDGNHPFWDEHTVEAMADAALAVVKALDAAEKHVYSVSWREQEDVWHI